MDPHPPHSIEAANDNDVCSWGKLHQDAFRHIATFLPRNQPACCLRLVCKATAAALREPQHTNIRLSILVPHEAFARQWDSPGAMRGLTRDRRLQLLCLTAASGDITNLERAAGFTGLCLSLRVLEAAAAAGQLEVCRWLKARGCFERFGSEVLQAAAQAGHRHVCEWLLEAGCEVVQAVVFAAARGGHAELTEWLWQQLRDPPTDPRGLLCIAAGCELPAMQRLYRALLPLVKNMMRGDPALPRWILIAAAGSPTPDWRAKVEWLEGQQYVDLPWARWVCYEAVSCPDAIERLAWLLQRRYYMDGLAAGEAAKGGNAAVLQYVLSQGGRPEASAVAGAAESGHLDVLKLLQAAGCELHPQHAVRAAARGGRLAVVAWLVEAAPGRAAQLGGGVMEEAARSGSVELLAWLRERGCPCGEAVFANAARAGSVEALEWLAEAGCPMPDDGLPYRAAIRRQDLATLRCLRRLGCPWGPYCSLSESGTFSQAVWMCSMHASLCRMHPSPCVLPWLLGEGCPVDWDAAENAACGASQYLRNGEEVPERLQRARDVLAWVRESRPR